MSDDIRLLTPDRGKKMTQWPEAFTFSLTVNNAVLFSMKFIPPLGFD